MRIGELAGKLEINPRTLRFYETVGLLPEPRRTPSGYRDYDSNAVERVRFIKSAQRLGLSLDDIKEILEFKERGELPCAYVLAVVDKEVDELDRKIAEFEALRKDLRALRSKARRAAKGDSSTKACVCHIIENQGPTRSDTRS